MRYNRAVSVNPRRRERTITGSPRPSGSRGARRKRRPSLADRRSDGQPALGCWRGLLESRAAIAQTPTAPRESPAGQCLDGPRLIAIVREENGLLFFCLTITILTVV